MTHPHRAPQLMNPGTHKHVIASRDVRDHQIDRPRMPGSFPYWTQPISMSLCLNKPYLCLGFELLRPRSKWCLLLQSGWDNSILCVDFLSRTDSLCGGPRVPLIYWQVFKSWCLWRSLGSSVLSKVIWDNRMKKIFRGKEVSGKK